MSTVDAVQDVTSDGQGPGAAHADVSIAPLGRRIVAEFIGTALLLIAVIGSGIMAQNLSPNDIGLELLENAAATGAALGAYCFTSSTSSANPAVTIARTLSDTFAGIAPSSVIPFVIAQFVGAAVAVVTVRVLWPGIEDVARAVVVPHQADAQMPEVERV